LLILAGIAAGMAFRRPPHAGILATGEIDELGYSSINPLYEESGLGGENPLYRIM